KRVADTNEYKFDSRSAIQAKAERSVNKALNAYAYAGDLLQDIENGSTTLGAVKDEDLPSELRKLSVEERTKEVEKRLSERREIRKQIMDLSRQRADYLAEEQKKGKGGAQNGFDAAVSSALRQQLAKKGIK